MKTFKYKITLHSFFQKPEDYIINNLDDLRDLKDYASQNQYKITIQEGEYFIKNGYWYDNNLKTYI